MMVSTPDWVKDAVFYQIFPDRFARGKRPPSTDPLQVDGPFEPWDSPPTQHGYKGGDLWGIAQRLDELVDLGVNALYLTPIFSSGSNHRYHAYDYRAVDPLLGGGDAFRALVEAVHARGMRIILDGVFNHSGRGFWPFHHILEAGGSSPYRDWFTLDREVLSGQRRPNAYPPNERPTPDWPLGYHAWWDIPALPKLNISHPPTRAYVLDIAERWLNAGADGWRLDVPEEIPDPDFWREFRRRCRAIDPDAYIVGEIWHEAPEWLQGDRFDALMNYPLATAILGFCGALTLNAAVIDRHGTLKQMLHPLDAPAFAALLQHLMTNYAPEVVAVQLNLLGSHDTPRALTMLGDDVAALRLAMLLQLTLPGAPCIYYGDEIGMRGGMEPASRGGYPVDPNAGDRELRAYVKALTHARTEHLALRRGTTDIIATGARALVICREADGQRALVAVNAGSEPERLTVELPGRAWGPLRELELPGIPSGGVSRPADGPSLELALGPKEGGILLEGGSSR